MIFVRNEYGSHNPDEAMSLDDFAVGAQALTGLLRIFLSEPVFEGACYDAVGDG